MSDKNVSLGQVAQLLGALARKGFGSRELTLFGQATPEQLEGCLSYLKGRAKLEPVAKRWWREGEDIVVPYPNEDRSGKELCIQNLDQFGRFSSRPAREVLETVDRIQGRGELVLIKSRAWGATYREMVDKLLRERSDLELAPPAAVLQLWPDDVEAFGHDFVIVTEPLHYQFTPRQGHEVVFKWYNEEHGANLWTEWTYHNGVGPNPWMVKETFEERYFLLKRKDK